MSLAINPEEIAAILLMDGWHEVASVDLEYAEIHWPSETRFIAQPKGETWGLAWTESEIDQRGVVTHTKYFAPLNHVFAIRYHGDNHR